MKTASPALLAHIAGCTTTLARCWRFETKSGRVVTVTAGPRDLPVNGEVYRAKEGLNPAATQQEIGGSVNNSEMVGALAPDLATEQQILFGEWDGAFVTVFEVNYRDLSMGQIILGYGTVGELKVGRATFQAEFRSLTQFLQQTAGEVFTAPCRYRFGDDRCGVDLGPITVAGSFTSVSSARVMADTGRGEAADYFGGGLLRVTSGALAGFAVEVANFSGGVFSLALPMPGYPAFGDTYEAIPGCRKRFEEDCIVKWSNGVRFGGFPHVPGADLVLGLAGTGGAA